jgi:hypothetical protein
MTTPADIERILSVLKKAPRDEMQLQEWIAALLKANEIKFTREFKLAKEPKQKGKKSIAPGSVDFIVGDMGLEVKLRGSGLEVARQLVHYLGDPALNSIVLIATKPIRLPMDVAIVGDKKKAIYVIDLWRNFL